MDKEDVVYTHIHTHTHTQEYSSAIKKEWNDAICLSGLQKLKELIKIMALKDL